MIRESELNDFSDRLISLVNNKLEQDQLSKNIKELALPEATKMIADEVEKLVK